MVDQTQTQSAKFREGNELRFHELKMLWASYERVLHMAVTSGAIAGVTAGAAAVGVLGTAPACMTGLAAAVAYAFAEKSKHDIGPAVPLEFSVAGIKKQIARIPKALYKKMAVAAAGGFLAEIGLFGAKGLSLFYKFNLYRALDLVGFADDRMIDAINDPTVIATYDATFGSLPFVAGVAALAAAVYVVKHEREMAFAREAENKDKLVRGSVLTTKDELIRRINTVDDALSWKGASEFTIADVPIAEGMITHHIYIVGASGSGKTMAYLPLLKQLIDKGIQAVIFDIKGDFVPKFYKKNSDDVIANYIDERFLKCRDFPEGGWNYFNEVIRPDGTFNPIRLKVLARAGFPIKNANDGNEEHFMDNPRMVFVEANLKLIEEGRANKEGICWMLTRTQEQAYDWLKDTPAASAVNPKAQGTGGGGIWNSFVRKLRYMLDIPDGKFSFTEWILNNKGSLFLAPTDLYVEELQPFSAFITGIMVAASITPDKRNPQMPTGIRRVWGYDEAASQGTNEALLGMATKGRSFGNCLIIGNQHGDQDEVIVGKANKNIFRANFKTKLILQSPDAATAKECAMQLGEAEYMAKSTNYGSGASANADRVGASFQSAKKETVLFSELMGLKVMEGYLVPAGGYGAAKIKFARADIPNVPGVEVFMERADLCWTAAPAGEASLNATQVGRPFNRSAIRINTILEALELQAQDDNGDWHITEAGKAYGVMRDFTRNGYSGQQVLWKASVREVVAQWLEEDAAAKEAAEGEAETAREAEQHGEAADEVTSEAQEPREDYQSYDNSDRCF